MPLILALKYYPNDAALALGPRIGWLLFLCAILAAAILVLDRDRFRKFWLRTEDPRAIGAFRIAFAIVLLANINNMWAQFEFLFTDEGLYLSDSARQYIGSAQFAGYGEGLEGEARGFFDLAAVLHWAKGPRYSLLFFWDSPTFFWWYLAAFELFTLSFLLGFKTRLTGFVSLFLTLGLMSRNSIYQSGADGVFRVMFVYLVLAKSGHAYSIDNWLRFRRLRRAGELDDRDGPGKGAGALVSRTSGDPTLLQAVYRRIPAWPRTFMILQLATIYLWTGSAKTGNVWWKGDSLYYALNLDHFSRVPTAYFGYIFGTNLFRVMTWTVHLWQIGFSLMVLGLILRWVRRERLDPPGGWRRWALRASWTGMALLTLAIVLVGLPVHYPEDRHTPIATVQWLTAGGGLALIAFVGWAWWRLRDRPFEFTLRGHSFTLDQETFCTLFLGRKLWLTLGLIFHLHIFVLMNIGMFAPVMIVVYIACLNGTEVATIVRRTGRALGAIGVPGIPEWMRRGEPITPTQDLSVPAPNLHRGGPYLGDAALIASFAFTLAGVVAEVQGHDWWWVLALAGVSLPLSFALLGRLRSDTESPDSGSGFGLAYGPAGRAFVATFIALQLAAVATWSIPDKDCTRSFRTPARTLVRPWMHLTQTYQSWNMFAPNPTRTNVFMKVFVTDKNGDLWDLYTDANSPRNKAQPWVIYDRMGKITRRVTGKGKHYLKWVARYHCRTWALEHDGDLPGQVQILKQWYAVPSPEKMRSRGPYKPEQYLAKYGHQKVVYTADCAREPDAQPTNALRRRHGLPEVDESQIRRAVRPHLDTWQRRAEIEAAKAARKQARKQARQRASQAKQASRARARP